MEEQQPESQSVEFTKPGEQIMEDPKKIKWITRTVKVNSLKFHPKNPRIITKEGIADMSRVLDEDGYRDLVSANLDYVLVSGHKRISAMLEKGEGEEMIEVRFPTRLLSPEEHERQLLRANRFGTDWKFFDYDMLNNGFDEDMLKMGGFTEEDLAGIKVEEDKEVEEDEAPEVSQEEPKSKLGEVYQLGRHRLMCGDSTKIEDVEKLMNGQKADMVFTDPPYGISYVGKTKDAMTIQNDSKTPEDSRSFWIDALSNIQTFMSDNGSYYVCSPQGSEMMMMMMALKECGFQLKQTLIWAKNTLIMGHSDYQYKHEVIFYGWKDGFTHKFYGDRTQTSVWEFNKPSKSDLHPTMKPVELCAKAIGNSSLDGGSVLDLFGGSGSTLIACEQLNRTCYMMELDPKYCDVIRKRYAKFIGREEEWETIV